MIKFISNGVDINVPDDYVIWMFFLRKLRCSEQNSLLSEVLVTEEKTLSSDLLHPPDQFRLTISQLVKPFKYLTKLSRSLLEPFGLKCKQLLLKCFLGVDGCVTDKRNIIAFTQIL